MSETTAAPPDFAAIEERIATELRAAIATIATT